MKVNGITKRTSKIFKMPYVDYWEMLLKVEAMYL